MVKEPYLWKVLQVYNLNYLRISHRLKCYRHNKVNLIASCKYNTLLGNSKRFHNKSKVLRKWKCWKLENLNTGFLLPAKGFLLLKHFVDYPDYNRAHFDPLEALEIPSKELNVSLKQIQPLWSNPVILI